MTLASSHELISGIPIRDLLIKIQFSSDDVDVQIAQSAINGLSEAALNARAKSHLTHATEIEQQVFLNRDRRDL